MTFEVDHQEAVAVCFLLRNTGELESGRTVNVLCLRDSCWAMPGG